MYTGISFQSLSKTKLSPVRELMGSNHHIIWICDVGIRAQLPKGIGKVNNSDWIISYADFNLMTTASLKIQDSLKVQPLTIIV